MEYNKMPYIDEKYYFTNTQLSKVYATLWNGFLKYKKLDDNPISFLDMDNILVDICNINFYVNLDNDNINISLCQDEKYYYYQFELHIKKVIKKFEEYFNIQIISGEFNATELKHQGDQIKYTITKTSDNKISLKKRILNWENYEKKKKNNTENERERDYDIEKDIQKMNIK